MPREESLMNTNETPKDTPKTDPLQQGETQTTEIDKDKLNTTISLSASETVSRYGSANAEYIKGYTGVDNETGQIFTKSLKKISEGKINPKTPQQNIKQQAGNSAEVAATSRDNAKAVISKSKIRTLRSDDMNQYGINHPVVDRVQILDGMIIEGSQTQMKFVGDPQKLLKDISKPDGKFARYRGIKLELPSEQYQSAKIYCQNQAKELMKNAERAQAKGNLIAAQKLREQAKNFDELAKNLKDSGLTTEDAIFYRKHPKLATVRDIAQTSHRAGIEGAKQAAIVMSVISTVTNLFKNAQEKKSATEVVQTIAKDTAKAAALGYATASTGSAVKSLLQQSTNNTMRSLAKTSAPTLAVNICISIGSSIKRYVSGEINEAELMLEVGEKGSGMLSGSMMAALGQIAIPIPFVGAAIGGMIGYTLSSFFYESALNAANDLKISREQLERITSIEKVAREQMLIEQTSLNDFIKTEIPALTKETSALFESISLINSSSEELAAAINNFAVLLGKNLEFTNMSEFEDFMNSDKPLSL